MNALRLSLLILGAPALSLVASVTSGCGGIVREEEIIIIDPNDGGGHPTPDSGPTGDDDGDASVDGGDDGGPHVHPTPGDGGLPDSGDDPPPKPPAQLLNATTKQITFEQQVAGPLPVAAAGSSCTPDFETYIFTLPGTLAYQRCEPAPDGSGVYSMQSGSLDLTAEEQSILLAACQSITVRGKVDPAACGVSGQSVYTAAFFEADGTQPTYWDCPRVGAVEADGVDQAVSTAEELTKSE